MISATCVRVVRVSVCLEDFGPIQSSLNQLKETGWLPEDFIPVPTMSLADFEVVFDIIEHPVQILHYLMKRELIDSSVNYLGHEIDLLGFYLRTWLDLSDFQPSGFYSFKQLAVDLDLYYASLDAGCSIGETQTVDFTAVRLNLQSTRTTRL